MYSNLFRPFQLGRLRLKNRVVMPAMGSGLAGADGAVGPEMIAYYARRARGGVGLMIVEVTAVDYVRGKGGPTAPRLDDCRFLPGWQQLCDAVHAYDCKIFAQLQHPGNQTSRMLNGGSEIISSSDVQSRAEPDQPRAMTMEEVREMVGRFVQSAAMAQAAGLDGVEIHGAHGYLIEQFFSPYTNRRTDEYGGSFENRMRFAAEIVRGVRRVCGPAFPISFRLTMDEFTPYGYGMEEGMRIARYISDLGVDLINVSCSTYESTVPSVEPSSFSPGWRTYMAEAVKAAVATPVVTVGVIRDPQMADDIVKNGQADLVAIGRGLIADPDWCEKARTGREAEICRCISCLHCIDELFKGRFVTCAVNPQKGREWRLPLRENGGGRTVVVVGAGPGGIAASLALARRGFRTVLFEAADRIGGQLVAAKSTPGKDKIGWYLDYAETMLHKLGVDLRLGVRADAAAVLAEAPYAVLLATGGRPIVPPLPGLDGDNVLTAERYLTGTETVTDRNVVVIGGGLTGCETAARLGAEGNRVTVVEMLPELCAGVLIMNKMDTFHKMDEVGVRQMPGTRLVSVRPGGVTVESVADGQRQTLQADLVLLALGVRPDNPLQEALEGRVEKLFVIGDARQGGKIANATHTGHILAMELE